VLGAVAGADGSVVAPPGVLAALVDPAAAGVGRRVTTTVTGAVDCSACRGRTTKK
jgi:hypothetical protein